MQGIAENKGCSAAAGAAGSSRVRHCRSRAPHACRPAAASAAVERHRDGVGHWLDACCGHCFIDVGTKLSHVNIRVLHEAGERQAEEEGRNKRLSLL